MKTEGIGWFLVLFPIAKTIGDLLHTIEPGGAGKEEMLAALPRSALFIIIGLALLFAARVRRTRHNSQ